MLLDRRSERAVLDRLLQGARDGRSGALVIRGAPGVGKTALLEYAIQSASDLQVVHVVGTESEMELAFAALHQLCMPMLDRLERLPYPQRDALGTAFGLAAGHAPDRFLVGLATLSLLSEFAEDRPLLCVVDDAQWLDGASTLTLAFVARRLLAESVAIVFAVREPPRRQGLEGLANLPLEGLGEEDARALLAAAVPGPLDDRVRDRIVAETRGNPLALLELPRGKSAPQLAGGFDVPAAADLPGQLERHYLERIRALPDATQRLLLLAAAEPLGDAALLLRAAANVGIGASALAPAKEDALLEVGRAVRFRHSLVRSAAYRAASPEDRRAVHQALADVTDPDRGADRRAWHRALAAAEPDEDVAAELEQSAGRAQMRGGLAAAAAFLELATQLTPDRGRRAQRALAAAQARQLSGAPDMALKLLSLAEAGPLTDLERARAHLVRGWAAFGSSRGRDAPPLLLAAARELESLDAALARDTYLEAFSAAMFVGRLADDVGIVEVARAARAARSVRVGTGRPQELLLDGLSVAITDGYADGAPLLRKAVSAFRAADMPLPEAIRWLWLATHAAHDVWDEEGWEALCDRHVALARQAGALSVLPLALSARIGLHLFAGELATAASLVEEVTAVTTATGSGIPPYGALALAAYRGHEAEATGLFRAARSGAAARGDGMGLTLIEHAEAVLYNGLGRHEEACAAAQRGAANPQELGFSLWSLPQLVEAATRSNRPALADDAMQRLAQTTSASGTDWALGVEARSRALVSDDGDAEPCYRAAIDHLGRTRVAGELARAHLLYGEWLRRQVRRTDAREQLRTAHQMFADMGMEAFAERARRQLAGTGEIARKRPDDPRDELRPQELQIAQLARDGLSNPEIGARLFLSPRTVEYHLRKVFAKLDISSRHELSNALPSERRADQVA
jgi:DNA-binding CsgD family transcriptional regulator